MIMLPAYRPSIQVSLLTEVCQVQVEVLDADLVLCDLLASGGLWPSSASVPHWPLSSLLPWAPPIPHSSPTSPFFDPLAHVSLFPVLCSRWIPLLAGVIRSELDLCVRLRPSRQAARGPIGCYKDRSESEYTDQVCFFPMLLTSSPIPIRPPPGLYV